MKVLAVPAVLVLVACASVDERLQSPSPQVRECAQWFHALDGEIDAAGVRVDRLLASLRDRAARSEAALHAYAERLLELDLESRRHEIANLPHATPGAALRGTRECGRLLREIDLAKPQARAALLEQAQVPDNYSDANRMIGVYPLTRLAFAAGIRRWQEETVARFRGEPSLPPGATLVRYAPPAGPPTPRGAVAGILGRAQFDPLGFASLSERELERLAVAYA